MSCANNRQLVALCERFLKIDRIGELFGLRAGQLAMLEINGSLLTLVVEDGRMPDNVPRRRMVIWDEAAFAAPARLGSVYARVAVIEKSDYYRRLSDDRDRRIADKA